MCSLSGKANVRITQASSSDIRRIEATYLWDVSSRRKTRPTETTLFVDPLTLAYNASIPALFVEQAYISSNSIRTSSFPLLLVLLFVRFFLCSPPLQLPVPLDLVFDMPNWKSYPLCGC